VTSALVDSFRGSILACFLAVYVSHSYWVIAEEPNQLLLTMMLPLGKICRLLVSSILAFY
jgi:hypothetical protein